MKDLKGFRPMLGETVEDLDALRYPLLASPKLDGIRAIWWDGQFYSRNLKPIPNGEISRRMSKVCDKFDMNLHGVEGELILGPATGEGVFRGTSSKVMTRDEDAVGVHFHMFDQIGLSSGFHARWSKLPEVDDDFLVKVPHFLIQNGVDAAGYEGTFVDQGFEGMILRDPTGLYKQGRSTLREQGLLKVKRFLDAEARVVGFVEQMHNANPATLDNLGYQDRSSHKAGMVPMDTLGTLVVDWNGQPLGIGTGFTAAERKHIWNLRGIMRGKWVKFKYLPSVKDLPRHPVFLGFREEGDK